MRHVNIDKQYKQSDKNRWLEYTTAQDMLTKYAIEVKELIFSMYLSWKMLCEVTIGVWILPHKIVLTGTFSLDLIFNLLLHISEEKHFPVVLATLDCCVEEKFRKLLPEYLKPHMTYEPFKTLDKVKQTFCFLCKTDKFSWE